MHPLPTMFDHNTTTNTIPNTKGTAKSSQQQDKDEDEDEETAYQWMHRVRTNKKRLAQNPIYFPLFDSYSKNSKNSSNSSNTCSVSTNHPNPKKKNRKVENSSFIATTQNLTQMAANAFFSRVAELNELKTRSKRWRRTRSKRSRKRRRLEKQNNDDDDYDDDDDDIVPTSASTSTCTSTSQTMEKLERELLESCFSKGTGIAFLDQIAMLQPQPPHQQPLNSNNAAIEIIGQTGTAKTLTLMSLAANYVATIVSTSNLLLLHEHEHSHDEQQTRNPTTRSSNDNANDNNITNPLVIIIDPEHSIHIDQLRDFVIAAILKRWNVTDRFRHYQNIVLSSIDAKLNRNTDDHQHQHQYQHHYQKQQYSHHKDHKMIEKQVLSALDLIQIIRPRDVANGYVSTLEYLHQTIPKHVNENNVNINIVNKNEETAKKLQHDDVHVPTLLLFDSTMSAFETIDKMYESLPDGNGLSGKNEFVRQMNRLRNDHNIVLVSTRTMKGYQISSTSSSSSSSSSSSFSNVFPSFDPWNKIMTHRIVFERILVGTKEANDGFDFIARISARPGTGTTKSTSTGNITNESCKDTMKDSKNVIFPFSVTFDGIKC